MIWTPFQKKPKRSLGVDIGTSSIKVVELSGEKERPKLENYGFSLPPASLETFRTFKENALSLSTNKISQTLVAVLKEAGISSNQSTFAIPDFSSFFTNFKLPPMTEKEIPRAVHFEARRHVPLPLSEVALDWSILEKEPSKERASIKILLVAVPREVINQYKEIARLTGLNVQALEPEAFALRRALVKKEDKRLICLIDIGAQSTTVNLVENAILKSSHSLDFSSNRLTQVLVSSLEVNQERAEQLKKEYGLHSSKIADLFLPLINLLLSEIKKITKNFAQTEGREPVLYVLAGGMALLPGLRKYFEVALGKKVIIADPFAGISYYSILETILSETGPAFSVAVGAALRGLE